MPTRLPPALIKQVGIEGPSLRHLSFIVPPDVTVRASIDKMLLSFCLLRIDQDDAVLSLTNGPGLVGLHTGCQVAVIAHRRNIGDIDHRHLSAFLLENVDPPVAVLRHRRRIAGKIVVDIFVHDRKRTQVAVGALGDIDDHIPLFHRHPRGVGNATKPEMPRPPAFIAVFSAR